MPFGVTEWWSNSLPSSFFGLVNYNKEKKEITAVEQKILTEQKTKEQEIVIKPTKNNYLMDRRVFLIVAIALIIIGLMTL